MIIYEFWLLLNRYLFFLKILVVHFFWFLFQIAMNIASRPNPKHSAREFTLLNNITRKKKTFSWVSRISSWNYQNSAQVGNIFLIDLNTFASLAWPKVLLTRTKSWWLPSKFLICSYITRNLLNSAKLLSPRTIFYNLIIRTDILRASLIGLTFLLIWLCSNGVSRVWFIYFCYRFATR